MIENFGAPKIKYRNGIHHFNLKNNFLGIKSIDEAEERFYFNLDYLKNEMKDKGKFEKLCFFNSVLNYGIGCYFHYDYFLEVLDYLGFKEKEFLNFMNFCYDRFFIQTYDFKWFWRMNTGKDLKVINRSAKEMKDFYGNC
jgi:hypothetical protein